ncbi:MAG: hypothetical protein HYW25_03945 [Candidatus Aenigmarchaeota archaeon]|nr:hypothetical protein [Candidatus Aenigmarchaeota archaeon]
MDVKTLNLRMPMMTPQRKKQALLGGIFVLLLAVAALGPVTGFVTFGNPYQEEIDTLEANLESTELALSETSGSLTQCQQDLSSKSTELSGAQSVADKCGSDLTLAQTELSASTGELDQAKVQLTGVQGELDASKNYATQLEQENSRLKNDNAGMQNNYSQLMENSAKDLCCVRKVFDKTLTHYYVENNVIVCTSDANRTPFSCG